MFRYLLIFIASFAALPAMAQEEYRFGNDAYIAGDNVTLSGAAVDDAFVAGNTVVISSPVEGSAHAAGRSVSISGGVAQSLYAAGLNVNVGATVGGDAQLFGDTIIVNDAVTGDLRAIGKRVEINASVGDSALISAETITLTGTIAGDASFSAKMVEFGDEARIDGTLFIYAEDTDAIPVPDHVVSAERIQYRNVEEFDAGADPSANQTEVKTGGGFWAWIGDKISSILILTAIATLVAAIAPAFLLVLRQRTLETPVRAMWMGFLSISTLAGSLFLFAMTGIGFVLIPASILLALALGAAGYVIGTYILGVGILSAASRPLPETLGERALAALVGAVAITVLALIPFVGWIAMLLVAVAGAGALIIRWFAPGFYTEVL